MTLVDLRPLSILEAVARYRPLVQDWAAFLDALSSPLPGCVWTNTLRISPDDLCALLRADGLAPVPLSWRPDAFRIRSAPVGSRWWYLAGLGHSQEEASLLPAILLEPEAGDRVLDLCAAPGGKAAQIAVALGNRATVVANDVRVDRMRALRATIERLGLVNVCTTLWDGTGYPRTAGPFDRVLVDAPCSGEGMLRRGALPASGGGPAISLRYSRRQRALLSTAIDLCRPGGRIVYSTCTFAPEENEYVIDAALRAYDGMLRVRPARISGFTTGSGITAWAGRVLDPSLAQTARIWPHDNDTGGFFIAVLEKAAHAAAAGAPAHVVTPLSAPGLAQALDQRFGLPLTAGQHWVASRLTARGVYLVDATHRPPAQPMPETVGLRFIQHKAHPPKLTTAAAGVIGRHATHNVINLEPEQVAAYLARRACTLSPAQAHRCTGSGHVIVRHQGHGLGVGYFAAGVRRLDSLYPKRLAAMASRAS